LAAKESLVICKSDRVGLQVFERETRGAQKTGGGQKKTIWGQKNKGVKKPGRGSKRMFSFFFIPFYSSLVFVQVTHRIEGRLLQ
jgi:hypothetical protein